MVNKNGVLVVGEINDGHLASISKEALACARKLADELGSDVAIAMLGSGIESTGNEAVAFGADKVYVVDDPLLDDFQVDAYLSILERIVQDYNPQIVLSTKSSIGRDLAPRLAFRLGTGLMQDCIELWADKDSGRLAAYRPVFGGNFIATVVGEGALQVAAIRSKAIEELEPQASRQGEIVKYPAGIDASVAKTRLVQRIKEETEGIKLEEASVVVSGGRGLGGPEPFEQLRVLAGLLGGALGASRAACDAGWLSSSHQVGLTGKTITPDLYITVAISGATQHMAGCDRAKAIVAINKDKDADIFKASRYGAVGDWNKILPAFIEQVKELVGG